MKKLQLQTFGRLIRYVHLFLACVYSHPVYNRYQTTIFQLTDYRTKCCRGAANVPSTTGRTTGHDTQATANVSLDPRERQLGNVPQDAAVCPSSSGLSLQECLHAQRRPRTTAQITAAAFLFEKKCTARPRVYIPSRTFLARSLQFGRRRISLKTRSLIKETRLLETRSGFDIFGQFVGRTASPI